MTTQTLTTIAADGSPSVFSQGVLIVGYAEDTTYQHPDDYPPTSCIFCTEAGVCRGDC